MRKRSLGLLLILIVFLASCQSWRKEPLPVSYRQAIDRMTEMPAWERGAYWKWVRHPLEASHSLPETSSGSALFVAERADAQSLFLWGDLSRWVSPGLRMERIEGTPLFFLDFSCEPQARLRYRFIPDNMQDEGFPDPLNPLTEPSGGRTDSILQMPGYGYPEQAGTPEGARGRLSPITGEGGGWADAAGNRRWVMLYTPSGSLRPGGDYPLFIFGDGKATVEESKLPERLDYLIEKNILPPLYALFVEPLGRDREYLGNGREEYLAFLSKELLPAARAATYASPDRMKVALVGASNGGEFVCWAGAIDPEYFGLVFNQSGVPSPEAVLAWKQLKLPARVCTEVGSWERDYNRDGAASFDRVLGQNPLLSHYLFELPQGHSWRMWGDAFAEGARWLLGL